MCVIICAQILNIISIAVYDIGKRYSNVTITYQFLFGEKWFNCVFLIRKTTQ